MAAAQVRRVSPWFGAGAALICWALLAVCFVFGAFRTLDLKLTDARFLLRGVRPADDRIAIVEVDDATVRAYGSWPLPRVQYAALFDVLNEGGASAIGVDLQFLGEDRNDPYADQIMARISSGLPRIVHSMSFQHGEPGTDAEAIAIRDSVQRRLTRHGIRDSRLPAAEVSGAALPNHWLTDLAPALAHVDVEVDPDGTVRRVPVLVRYGDLAIPALALRLASAADGDTLPPQIAAAPGGMRIRWRGGRGLFVPVDDNGSTAIDFAGDRPAFHNIYPMIRLLNWYNSGQLDSLRHAVQGRIVLVGTTAAAEVATDLGADPFSENSPRMFVHANALDSILRGRFLRSVPMPLYAGVLALVALLMGFLFASLAVPVGALVALAGAVVLFGVDLALFAWTGVDAPPTTALLLGPLAYAAIAIYRYVFLDRRNRDRDRELELARRIQQKLLPVTPPKSDVVDVHGFNIPALEVGGDYFDWITLEDGSLLLALGDVSGKGVAASLLMSHLRASLHAESRPGRAPVEIITSMHRSLSRAVEPGRFATFFLASISANGSSITYCNAGHNPPFLLRGKNINLLGATGLPLGMIEDMTYEQAEHTYESGDVLVVYSDGVTECPAKGDDEGEDYGDPQHERFESLARRLVAEGKAPEPFGKAILADVTAWCHGKLGADDITIVVARRR